MHELLTCSGSALARRIRGGELRARAVVEAHVARIERVNPRLNAVVAARFEQALREADAADARVAREPAAALPPLLGVPCTIKECFALAGMPQTAGLVARVGRTASVDAQAVARLRAAGAIPLGVTNVSELCMWIESSNRVYGRTRNPYDPRRSVGGSSGGEGAIVGAGGAPFGLGSDVGGSIRIPAFFNGVFGHKPTGGLVPNAGQHPPAEGGAQLFLCTGPLARRAEDLWPLLQVLAGPEGTHRLGAAPSTVQVARLRVLDVPHDGRRPVAPALRAAQARAAAHLGRAGAAVERAADDGLRDAIAIWSAMMAAEARTSFGTLLGDGASIRAGRELGRWALGRSAHTLPALALALLEQLPPLLPARAARALADGRALGARLAARLGEDGVMLYPSHPFAAPRHGAALLRPLSWGYTGLFNVLGMPATQVPLGLGPDGLPVGVQVIAAPGNDRLTIAVALELERAFGGWRAPPEPAGG